MPYIAQVAKGKRAMLQVFGDDYPTPDGTGIRDYIHVMDLAEGHVAALEGLGEGYHVYNLGTGKGVSVLELIHTFERVNAVSIPYRIVGRRPGDIAESFADVSKAKRDLVWETKRGLEENWLTGRLEGWRICAAMPGGLREGVGRSAGKAS